MSQTESSVGPRSFSSDTVCNSLLFIVYVCRVLLNPKCIMIILHLLTSGCSAVVYSAWSAIAALHLSVIVFSLDLELRLLHSFGFCDSLVASLLFSKHIHFRVRALFTLCSSFLFSSFHIFFLISNCS